MGSAKMTYIWMHDAYLKMVFHAYKYLNAPLTGICLGYKESKDDRIYIVDAVPLFHHQVLAPMLELAFMQVSRLAAQRQLSLVGFYVAEEIHCDALSTGEPEKKESSKNALPLWMCDVSAKMKQAFPQSFVFKADGKMMSHSLLSLPGHMFTSVSSDVSSSPAWKMHHSVILDDPDRIKQSIDHYFRHQRFSDLVDFERYLDRSDGLVLDYTNPKIFETFKKDV
ncbi:ER membrane protein complex subunit 8/9 homolog [Schistocerca gregaria]|uniref:ER membrane protein complex subunit 8/9 homolog n=1 Tax=Schistocerca gregaria TaxID=7010 RepID=UPI00211DDFB7|nr:ER membrane protein complex subunit 8/9 homolog [Schistocerca gregaria]